jgi:hypothetical protein
MISDNQSEEVAAVKNQVFTLLVALIVVSGTLTTVLYQQASQANKDIDQGEKAYTMMYQSEASMTDFARKMLAYSDRHPDIKPLLTKYNITPATVAPAAPAPKP